MCALFRAVACASSNYACVCTGNPSYAPPTWSHSMEPPAEPPSMVRSKLHGKFTHTGHPYPAHPQTSGHIPRPTANTDCELGLSPASRPGVSSHTLIRSGCGVYRHTVVRGHGTACNQLAVWHLRPISHLEWEWHDGSIIGLVQHRGRLRHSRCCTT